MKHIPFLFILAFVASGFAAPARGGVPFHSPTPDSITIPVDGREAFIIGIGLGFGLTNLSFGSKSNSEAGLSVDFKIGHAPSDQVAIYVTGKGSSVPSGSAGTTTIVGVGAIGATYYFQPSVPSPTVSFGLGISFINTSSNTTQGFGLFFGGGYEFGRHWSAELDLLIGSPGSGCSGTWTLHIAGR
jgi:hypothetical protein